MAKIQGAHIPLEAKNLAINGGMDYWQRVEGNTSTVNTAATSSGYTADMMYYTSQGTTVKNYSVVRSTDVPSQAQSGFVSTYSYLFTMITGIASPVANDVMVPISYRMEGFDYKKIHARNVTFGFWVKASVAGTYSFALGNGAGTRSYVTTFTVNGAATWQFVTINVNMDSAGTWVFDNGLSLVVYIGTVSGTTASTGTLSAWQAGLFAAATGATNWIATNGATLQIAQLSIVEGPLGFSATGFQRAGKNIQQELAMCQRYYEKSFQNGTAPATGAGRQGAAEWSTTAAGAVTIQGGRVDFKVTKRISPSPLVFYNPVSANAFARSVSNSADATNTQAEATSERGFTILVSQVAGFTAAATVSVHWIADAGL